MLICIEGPDCTGKTTQSEKLEKYIKHMYPKLTTWHIHFPLNNEIRKILNGSLTKINPFYMQMMFLTDFYTTMYSKQLPIINKIKSYKDVVIFDRYYYSTLIMAKHTIDPSYFNENIDEDLIECVKDKLDSFVNEGVALTGIPYPDLTFVLMSRWEQIKERLSKKNKDFYEENEKMMKDVYSAYVDALSSNESVFNSNSEPLNPFVIHSTKTLIPKEKFNTDIEKRFFNALTNNNYKTEDEIHKEITDIFDIFLSEYMNRNFFDLVSKNNKYEEYKEQEFDLTDDLIKFFNNEKDEDFKLPVIKSYQKRDFYKEDFIPKENMIRIEEHTNNLFIKKIDTYDSSNKVKVFLSNGVMFDIEISKLFEARYASFKSIESISYCDDSLSIDYRQPDGTLTSNTLSITEMYYHHDTVHSPLIKKYGYIKINSESDN